MFSGRLSFLRFEYSFLGVSGRVLNNHMERELHELLFDVQDIIIVCPI